MALIKATKTVKVIKSQPLSGCLVNTLRDKNGILLYLEDKLDVLSTDTIFTWKDR